MPSRTSEFHLEQLGPGIWGRKIPPEEHHIDPEFIVRLAVGTGSEPFAQWIYRLYKLTPQQVSQAKARMASKG